MLLKLKTKLNYEAGGIFVISIEEAFKFTGICELINNSSDNEKTICRI